MATGTRPSRTIPPVLGEWILPLSGIGSVLLIFLLTYSIEAAALGLVVFLTAYLGGRYDAKLAD